MQICIFLPFCLQMTKTPTPGMYLSIKYVDEYVDEYEYEYWVCWWVLSMFMSMLMSKSMSMSIEYVDEYEYEYEYWVCFWVLSMLMSMSIEYVDEYTVKVEPFLQCGQRHLCIINLSLPPHPLILIVFIIFYHDCLSMLPTSRVIKRAVVDYSCNQHRHAT